MSQFYRVAKTKRRQEVDLSSLPRKKHLGKEVVDWTLCNQHKVKFIYGDTEGEFSISFKERSKRDSRYYTMHCVYEENFFDIDNIYIQRVNLSKIVSTFGKHIYEVGDTVNGCEVLKKIKMNRKNNSSELGYLLKCQASNKTFEAVQSSLKRGSGSPYTSGKRFYEPNTFASKKDLNFLFVREADKKITLHSKAKILCKCTECGHTQERAAYNLTANGFRCEICSKGKSYPERFMGNFLSQKNIGFTSQKTFEGLPKRRFDFYIPSKNMVIECHGMQHYSESLNFGQTKKQKTSSLKKQQEIDSIKKAFCLSNNINYVVIDCRFSSAEYISQQINRCEFLPQLLDEDVSEIAKLSASQENYNFKEMQNFLINGKTINEISRHFNLPPTTIRDLFDKAGVNFRKEKRVVCLNTKTVFTTIKKSSEWLDKTPHGFSVHAKREAKSWGKHPVTGEPLKWMYYEDYVEKYGTEGLTEYIEEPEKQIN